MKLIFFIAISFFSPGSAVIQNMTLYDEQNQQGNYITLTGKYPDLSDWNFFLRNTRSYCITGWIYFFDGLNYQMEDSKWTSGFHENPFCFNTTGFSLWRSGRLTGPLDTDIPTLAIYEAQMDLMSGEEILFTGAAANNFPFNARHIITFGNSEWKMFTENDFAGDSWCFESPNSVAGFREFYPNSTHPVRSVIRGCGVTSIE